MGFRDLFRRKPKGPLVQETPPAVEQAISAEDVFTPTSSAKRNFVERGTTGEDVETALKTPGTQLVIYGESGAGKSSLVEHTLNALRRKSVTTHCTGATTYDEILASIFDELNVYVVSGTSAETRADMEITGTVGSDFMPAKIESMAAVGSSNGVTRTPFVPPQITAQQVEAKLAERQTTWIIEDLHKVSHEAKARVADVLKVFVNRSSLRTAVVVLGASETASAIVQAPSDVKRRVAQIAVPPLDEDELGKIIDEGSRIMNVDMSAVRGEIIRLSVGVASVTHALALRCLQSMKVEIPVEGAPAVVTHDVLAGAARSYARSMTSDMKERFDSGVLLKRMRKYDNCAVILKALASLPERGGTHAEILSKIHETVPEYPPSNLSSFLPQLGEDERGALVRNAQDGRWRYDEPLLHTYAQILFDIELQANDLFADELVKRVPDGQRQEAQAQAAADDVVV